MIGIDFGTTNSCVAVRGAFGDVEPVAVATGPRPPYDTVLRTAVLNPQLGVALIGQEAINRARQRLTDEDRYLESFKPYLDEQKLRTSVPVKVNVGYVYDPLLESELERIATETLWLGGQYTRNELVRGAAHIFSHLLQRATNAGGELDQIWLGMPVNFSSCARKRLICALAQTWDEHGKGFFAGYSDALKRVRFVLEPVAVAAGPIRDALDVEDRENVLVFDHGGGTLDLSLITFERRPEFEHPVPVRELAAVGSSDVAGRAIDLHFREYLDRQPSFARETKGRRAYAVDAFVEECKQRLSTEATGEAWPGVFVGRDEFERSIETVLRNIDRLVCTAIDRADLTPDQIDRVVMTGGSSLIPAVQAQVRAAFPHLDEYRLLRYDAADRRGVESAITEVAKGLVDFGDRIATQSFFEQVALWDVDISIGGKRGFKRIIDRGTPYKRNGDGTPALGRRVPLEPIPGEGTSIGVYEDQLGPRFMFGLADLPQLPEGGELHIVLRPERLLPALRVVDASGRVAQREIRDSRDPSDWYAQADVMHMGEEQLARYFAEDADYHPINGYTKFESAPLVRRLRVGDLVEWCQDRDGSGPGRTLRRCRGEVIRIREIASGEFVDEMASWEPAHYVFDLREKGRAETFRMQGRNGSLRLSPRPWRDY
jgi:hypothetical protein